MQACCRALGGYLFGCLDDHEILPQTQRSLYGPSYEHYCAQDGHVALPADFNSYVPHRFSAFNADKRWLCVRMLPPSVSAYYYICVRMLLYVRIPVYMRPHLQHIRTEPPHSLQRSQEATASRIY